MKNRIFALLGAATLAVSLTAPAHAERRVLWQEQAAAASSDEFVGVMREFGLVGKDSYDVQPQKLAEFLYNSMKSKPDFNSWPKEWREKRFYIDQVLQDNGLTGVNRVTVGQLFERAKAGTLYASHPGRQTPAQVQPAPAAQAAATTVVPAIAAPAPQASASPVTEVAAAAPVAPATQAAAPAASPAPAPKAAPVTVDSNAIRSELNAFKRQMATYNAQPVAQRDPAKDAEMAELSTKFAYHEKLFNQLPKDANGQIDLTKLTPTQQVTLREIRTEVRIASSRVEEIVGRGWLDGLTVAYAPLYLLLLIAGIFGYRRLSGKIKLKANDARVDLVSEVAHKAKASAEALVKEVAELTTRVDAAEANISDIREQGGYSVITLEPDWYEKVKAAAIGVATDLGVLCDGEVEFIITVERADDDNAFITAGVQGQESSNTVKIGNLRTIVRSAAKKDNFRLNRPANVRLVA